MHVRLRMCIFFCTFAAQILILILRDERTTDNNRCYMHSDAVALRACVVEEEWAV